MGKETERKFLVIGDYKSEAYSSDEIIQGYISSSSGRTVRVRIREGRGYLTIKGPARPGTLTRFEWEKEIPVDEARELLDLALPGLISKKRHLVRNSDGVHVWEVDEFFGDNEGLTVAEIELQDENEPFDRPSWLGEEVTGDRRYFNSMLMQNPYKNWGK